MNEINPELQTALDDYIQYYEKLTLRSVPLVEKMAAPGIRFKDPFNDVQGTDAYIKIMSHMFKAVDKPKFKIEDYAWGREERTAYLKWVMNFEYRGKKARIVGMTELLFSKDHKVLSHIDHWDAAEQFFEHIPIVGSILRFVKSRLKI